MNSNDKAFLEKFCVRESAILIGLENVGWYSLYQSKNDQISFHQSPLNQIFICSP